eukprot:10439668-Karenia_brevis.AAC.1
MMMMIVMMGMMMMMMGSGYHENKGGVAILVNAKWDKSMDKFVAIDERIAYMHLHVGPCKIRFIAVYFPRSGDADQHVQR